MDPFALRARVVGRYQDFVRGFLTVRAEDVNAVVERELASGLLWPEPHLSLNPSFESGGYVDDLARDGLLHEECQRIFRRKRHAEDAGEALRLHAHQKAAIEEARAGRNYVVTTGTGSGKSLTYIVPIVDSVLRHAPPGKIHAIVVYPMNALANSQGEELEKFVNYGFPGGRGPVRFARYTGQEKQAERDRIKQDPPHILLTNYVMLELLLTRFTDQKLVEAAADLRFLVLDELHSYRGRQGSDVALLVRRAREAFKAPELIHVGTSATLAGPGTPEEQRAKVAEVASRLFGAPVAPGSVIGESLRRLTEPPAVDDPAFRQALTDAVRRAEPLSADLEGFRRHPLTRWLESEIGVVADPSSGRPVRVRPRSLGGRDGVAAALATVTGLAAEDCMEPIQACLLSGTGILDPDSALPLFAFRLHQFLSRGDTVYATPEPQPVRFVTVRPQTYAPDGRDRRLFPLAFCRHCGQEYYLVRRVSSPAGDRYEARTLDDRAEDDDATDGFLFLDPDGRWDESELPGDWLDPARAGKVKGHLKGRVPAAVRVSPDGRADPAGTPFRFVPAPFRFCLECGVAYGGRIRKDFAKLATLGSEGRSSATTILSLGLLGELRASDLSPDARKLLSFSDNRQDASLQAGHFNDFIQIVELRAALYAATRDAGPQGIGHTELTGRVFDALNLPFALYAANPEARYGGDAVRAALREVLGYRLYQDLRRGWRITAPNLEQTGLLEIEYEHLTEVGADEELWQDAHPALATAAPGIRCEVARVFLNFLRSGLAISVNFLDPLHQERIVQLSSQHLRGAWAIDEDERLEPARHAILGSEGEDEDSKALFVSPRGGFGLYLSRPDTFPALSAPLKDPDRVAILEGLVKALRRGSLLDEIDAPGRRGGKAWRVPAAAIRWVAGDGTRVRLDPVRVPRPPKEGGRVNPYFRSLYTGSASALTGLEAREHTAQVPADERRLREDRFRAGTLPLLFCSPTMELGVDIRNLAAVHLRNVPPTPANYAQRSGRAGRGGQPALVMTYCSAGSPHDQYFFRHQREMVSGQVAPPRLDLANEDLVRAHVHALWLSAAQLELGSALSSVLNLDDPALPLQERIRAALDDPYIRERTRGAGGRFLAALEGELPGAPWYREDWLERTLAALPERFESTCGRWRDLYRAALHQLDEQHAIIRNAASSKAAKDRAKRLHGEALAQIDLLKAESDSSFQSDFYSYRYIASEGFLPGYSFPRLPLTAFIPGRRRAASTDEFLSRPRFLAISEFGPRNFIYHEGSRYLADRVDLPVPEGYDAATGKTVWTKGAKICQKCGYLHPLAGGIGPDLCERCAAPLPATRFDLFRMRNVKTRRKERIHSDEEERQRQGYELVTAVRFADSQGRPDVVSATVVAGGKPVLDLVYGGAATLWRMNLGWRRRKDKTINGFVLDLDHGRWANDSAAVADDDEAPEEAGTGRTQRVVPFVEERKNSLLLRLAEPPAERADALLVSLQAALKRALEVELQLEDSELTAEPLPSRDDRAQLLYYEATEGGAVVLRRLVEEPEILPRVATRALELCHFDPVTGEDRKRPAWATEDCQAACYDCLLSYRNQVDHPLLDRQLLCDLLLTLRGATLVTSPVEAPREEHLERLSRAAASELERRFLRFLEAGGHRLPDEAGPLLEAAGTRPDFVYRQAMVAIYVDGPPHDFRERAARDEAQQARLENLGWTVLRFRHDDSWRELVGRMPSLFGGAR